MKKSTLILAALLTGASLPAAEGSAPAITADATYVSRYVFRGIELAEGAFQPSVKMTVGDFYIGVWSSLPTDNGYEHELDYYAGYGFKLSDAWSLDLGATVYHYPGVDTPGVDESTFEGYIGLNGSIESVTLAFYAYEDFTLDVTTFQGTVGYSIPMNEKVSMNLSANLGHASPNFGDGYTYYGLGAQLPYKISDAATVTIGVNYASHDLDGVDDGHFWFNAGFNYAF